MSPAWVFWIAIAVAADAVMGASTELSVGCLCLVWLYEKRGGDRVVWAWILGLWRDTLSIAPFGVNALPFLLLAVILECLHKSWFVNNAPTRAAIVFGGVLMTSLLSGILSRWTGADAGLWAIGWSALTRAAMTSLIISLAVGGGSWLRFGSRLLRA
jgi:rod shape-determining protein MreD